METEAELRELRHREARARQDELFKRNRMIKQKIVGVLICLVTIAGWWLLAEHYEQFEYILIAAPFIWLGLYAILTKRDLMEEEKR